MQATFSCPSSAPRAPKLPPVFVMGTDYVSHRRAADDYRAAFESLGCLTEDLDEAKVVFLHLEAPLLGALVRDVPALKTKYLINYAVWESTELPEPYALGLKLVDAIWTASSYCAGLLYKAGFEAAWLPHIVRAYGPASVSPEALAEADRLLGTDPHRFDVLCITKRGDLRKNFEGLQNAMPALRRHHPQARLVVKTGSWLKAKEGVRSVSSGVLSLDTPMSDELVRALVLRSMVLVNVSHCEGWGLTLTEAMAAGVPVISTAYGGSMTFLSRKNALLVPSVEGLIGGAWSISSRDARWGHPIRGGLEAALIQAFAERNSSTEAQRIAQAKADMRVFAPERVERMMRALLVGIANQLADNWQPKARVFGKKLASPTDLVAKLRHV